MGGFDGDLGRPICETSRYKLVCSLLQLRLMEVIFVSKSILTAVFILLLNVITPRKQG